MEGTKYWNEQENRSHERARRRPIKSRNTKHLLNFNILMGTLRFSSRLLFNPILQRALTLLPLLLFHCYVPHKKEAAYKAASAILFGSENAITRIAEARDNITMVI